VVEGLEDSLWHIFCCNQGNGIKKICYFFFKNAKWFLILLTILCESNLEILEGEVREELANEKNHGCSIK